MADDTQAHGGQHPLVAAVDGREAWQFAEGVYAWRIGNDVVLQGDDGDVTIPGAKLPIVARALLAVHVMNGRES